MAEAPPSLPHPAGTGGPAAADGGARVVERSPLDPDLDLLFARHRGEMVANSPPESIHMLSRAALTGPGVSFYALRDGDGTTAGMAALRRDGPQAEVKSMHVLAERRGRGLSRLLLRHVIDVARAEGVVRLNLETGSQPMFTPARRLYARAGFVECPPFGGYVDDPNSVFMTLPLSPRD